MLTDPNPPNRTAEPPPAPVEPLVAPPLTLDASTFRRFVTAAWRQPLVATRARTVGRAPSAPAIDALVALRLERVT